MPTPSTNSRIPAQDHPHLNVQLKKAVYWSPDPWLKRRARRIIAESRGRGEPYEDLIAYLLHDIDALRAEVNRG